MIQRIQSVFLFLVAASMACVLFLPIWFKQGSSKTASLDAYKLIISGSEGAAEENTTAIIIAILAGIAALVALYSIFQYRNRLTQIKFGALNSLLIGGTLLTAYYFSNSADKVVESSQTGEYLSGFYM